MAPRLSKVEKQLKIVDVIKDAGRPLHLPEIAEQTDIVYQTAYYTVQNLVSEGSLVAIGKGKAKAYGLPGMTSVEVEHKAQRGRKVEQAKREGVLESEVRVLTGKVEDLTTSVNRLTQLVLTVLKDTASTAEAREQLEHEAIRLAEPLRPKVLILGLLPAQEQIISNKTQHLFRSMKFVKNNTKGLAKTARNYDYVLVMTKFVSHSIYDQLNRDPQITLVNVTGGLSELISHLNLVSGDYGESK